MNKYRPYILPLIVVAVVFLLVVRWYNTRPDQLDESAMFGEGVEIEQLTDEESQESMMGGESFATTEMEMGAMEAETPAVGTIRHKVENNRVTFSVMADLPEPEGGEYYVWLKEVDGEGMKQAFTLVEGKGGYIGSAAVSAELLPFEVIISDQSNSASVVEDALLRAVIEE